MISPMSTRSRMRDIALVSCLALLLLPLCCSRAYATDADSDVEVTVSIPQILQLVYTGDSDLEFVVTLEDIEEGSKGLVNQGDLKWWANCAPWDVTVQRTEWEQTAGSGWPGPPDRDIHLQIKQGPPDNTKWLDVTTTETVWPELSGNTSTGSGTFPGVDWKIKQIGWDDAPPNGFLPPGTYECTVTIAIVYAG